MTLRHTLAAGLLTATFILVGCQSVATDEIASSDLPTYKIGVIAPLSGDAGAYGQEGKNILDYRVAELNADPSAAYQIELVYEDGKCDGASAAAAFQKLTEVDGIKHILGGLCSSETLAIAPLVEANQHVIAVTPWSSSPDIEGASERVFSFSYSDEVVGQGIADVLSGYKTIALISEQNDYNEALRRVIVETLAASHPDVQIVADESFAKGTADFRNQLEKLKQSGAEAVFLNPNAGTTAEALLRQLAEMPDWKPQFVSQISYNNPDILAVAPRAAEGMILVDSPGLSDAEFVAYRDGIIAEKDTLNNLGTFFTASALDAVQVYTDLIHQHGNDVEAIRNALATQTFRGWLGELSFGGHSFVQGIEAAKIVVHDGKPKPVTAE